MNSVSVQIQRFIIDAISSQVLPQIQNALKTGSGSLTQNGWNIPTGRQERHTEDHPSQKVRSSSRSEPVRTHPCDEVTFNAHDMVTGDNESPVLVPEFLTRRMPSRTALNQSHIDHNPLRDTTIPAQQRAKPVAEQDPINRLADVLTSMQNRTTAQQKLTFRPVSSNTKTFDGKSEKFKLFEYLFHTMIKM